MSSRWKTTKQETSDSARRQNSTRRTWTLRSLNRRLSPTRCRYTRIRESTSLRPQRGHRSGCVASNLYPNAASTWSTAFPRPPGQVVARVRRPRADRFELELHTHMWVTEGPIRSRESQNLTIALHAELVQSVLGSRVPACERGAKVIRRHAGSDKAANRISRHVLQGLSCGSMQATQ